MAVGPGTAPERPRTIPINPANSTNTMHRIHKRSDVDGAGPVEINGECHDYSHMAMMSGSHSQTAIVNTMKPTPQAASI